MDQDADLSLDELARRITGTAVRLAAATAEWLGLIAEFDRREGWGGAGLRSCAHWLAWQCGLSPGAAREHVRVARALTGLPRIRQSFAAGRLSYSKVRALTRVAEPDTEAVLLDLAREATAAQVERVVRAWRRSDAPDAGTARDKRRFEHWWDDDGMLHVRMCLDAEEGAAFLAGVDSLAERDARRERAAARRDEGAGTAPDGPSGGVDEVALARERTAARRCAAVARLAAAAPEADRRAGGPPRREVVVHVDAAVVADDAAAGRAHLEGGPALHGSQVRRMLCEATVVTMLSRGREPLAVGRARRLATRAQRRALWRRDGGCARPGCPETRVERLHAHHLRHWVFGGATDLDNLVLLCDADHGLAHDLDLAMTRRAGELVAVTPDGRRVWGPADAAFTAGSAERRAATTPAGAAGSPAPVTRLPLLDGTPDLGTPDLPGTLAVGGERMDLGYVVSVLLRNRDLERRVRAENAGEPVAAA
ncbi:HNH endonuclease [Geodermatophilus saharensis]|uniref:HNH endonuclease n=1 Tax=Geodermatophilus saharensis TaxID=1137994 RepID=A0A239H3T1_9ACTN|nr:HNH endonuclease signature motif containing protein [Geodermatophilus saharensis]SNS75473.1 HNH endonuclease [Geodermatophilus saharensis]